MNVKQREMPKSRVILKKPDAFKLVMHEDQSPAGF